MNEVKLGRTKLTNIVKNVIRKSEKDQLAATLRSTVFSVLTNESTDLSITKVIAILVCHYNCESKCIETNTLCLAEIYRSENISSKKDTNLIQKGMNVDPEGGLNTLDDVLNVDFDELILRKKL